MTTKHNLTYRGGRTRDRIVDYLAKHPGTTSDKIADELGITMAASSTALNSMYNAGIVARAPTRLGRYYAYMLKADSAAALRPIQLIMPMGDEIEAMKARLAELEAFKAEAVAKHPDLVPIDYEAYRPALLAYYAKAPQFLQQRLECIEGGDPLSELSRQTIDGLIAAAKLFPEDAA